MIEVRAYGHAGPLVILLHGGPGAAGEMAPVARELARGRRVLEPLQRSSGAVPLTVALHVADLHEVVECHCGGAAPALVGYSWGAMLALCYAAEHPVERLVLVGCGTFDPVARAELVRRRAAGGDAVDPVETGEADVPFDERGHHETWNDMLRLQADGTYPARFSRIRAPVTMIHGAEDPHPGRMIRDGLAPHVHDLGYVELPSCGHKPWVERHARAAFFAHLDELVPRCG